MFFKTIPGTPGWEISDKGVLRDPEGKIRNVYRNGDGYITAAIQTAVDGVPCWRTVGLHRLVALAHIKCDGNPDDYHVNHIDLDKTNNEVSNLEWLTVRENNIHAALFSGSAKRPALIAYKLHSDETFYINTVAEASKMFKCSELEIWDIVKSGGNLLGYRLQANVRGVTRPPSLKKPTFKNRNLFGRPNEIPVIIKNITTNEVVGYKSINDAAREHGVSASHIYQCITEDTTKLFRRNFIIILDGGVFPSISEEDLEILRDPTGKEVWAYSYLSNTYSVWPSASSFIEKTGLSKKAVTTRLRKGKIERVGDFIFTYKKNGGYVSINEFLGSPQVSKF